MTQTAKTPGQLAYEADLLKLPTYHTGEARRSWAALSDFVKASWEKNPTARHEQQQVDVVATITLCLPMGWDADEISVYLRSGLMGTFSDDLPPSIPDENGNAQSPVNFTFMEEREIYDSDSDEETRKGYFVRHANLPEAFYIEANTEVGAAEVGAGAACDLLPYGEAAGEYHVHAFDPLGGIGRLLGTYKANEEGELVD